jgi:hypothetical protein
MWFGSSKVIRERRASHGRIHWLVVTTAIAAFAFTSSTPAQTATAPELKAAFLYNFAKFTEWPDGVLAAGQPLMFCVVNDRAVAERLLALTKGRSIDGHAILVSAITLESAALASCRLLFTSGLDETRSGALLESIGRQPILTVSDLDTFAQLGGVANFFVENGTMRFAFNPDAARRARIYLSSKLLSLAKIVTDDSSVLRH